MAAPSSVFRTAIESVLSGWTALQVAVSHGFGGPLSKDKAEWLVGALEQWIAENPDLYPDELEEFLEQQMYSEFETVVEDNSIGEVSRKLLGYHKLISQGKEEDVRESIRHIPTAGTAHCRMEPGMGAHNDDDDEDMDEGSGDEARDTKTSPVEAPPSGRAAHRTREPPAMAAAEACASPSENGSMDADGESWTIVTRSAAKRK